MIVFAISEQYLRFCGHFSEEEMTKISEILKIGVNCAYLTAFINCLVITALLCTHRNSNNVPASVNQCTNICVGSTTLVSFMGFIRNEENMKHQKLRITKKGIHFTEIISEFVSLNNFFYNLHDISLPENTSLLIGNCLF